MDMNTIHLQENESFNIGIDVPIEFSVQQLVKMKNCCIFFVSKGSAYVEVNFSRYKLEKNTILILGINSFFQCLEKYEELICSYISFTNDIWAETTSKFEPEFFTFLRKYPQSPILPIEYSIKNYHILYAIKGIYQEQSNRFRKQKFMNYLQILLLDIYDKIKEYFVKIGTDNTPHKEELFEKFILLVFKYSSTKREVKFYADKLCITTRYLSTITQGMTGKTPKYIINTHCIQEIKMLLRTTNKSIQEIAYTLHFPDQSIFARYFRMYTGTSPLEYRNKQKIYDNNH